MTLLGGFFYALHIVMVAKLARDKDPVLVSILQFGSAAAAAWVVTLVFESRPQAVSGSIVGAILFLSVGCTALALLLQNVGQKYTHPAAASIILSLESVFGVLFSVLFYGEKLSFRLAAGFVLIFAAIIISETKLGFLKRNVCTEKVSGCGEAE